MIRTVLTLIIVAILLIGGVWYINKMPNQKDVTTEGEIVKVMAVDLFNKYAENEVLSDSLYLNKIVEVEGNVIEMDLGPNGEKMFILKEEDDMYGVVCTLDGNSSNNSKYADSVKIGDHVVIKGICSGFDSEVKMVKCIIVNTGKVNA